ncbi:MAG TPA: hypothetical protein DCS07_13620 [Bdellovibrionales bacterium]|nr:MAG: hypothetical protein A2Z97_05055 [Bdellovibrionales bacterium GWB1_52_6]OFZ04559.1 MAG: hypothetical protein A2X97_13135 [Bdellovibrionales bacterium GWA1_52_35]OFZ42938.1 MAG: hypothetical protein A2070_10290 [Bdellovibrionales bacterium GWC1_52_8]HAR43647.1 hypothetical protein [Bdellovibrionales bacterium]HCM39970.1 hypothetical protein [Bdellovibrionales bacterium]
MKRILILLLALTYSLNGFCALESYEDWKSPADPAEAHFGVLMGMGVLDSSAGLTLLGTASKKIVHQGFIPDINNSVSIEFQGGPLFVEGSRAFSYSTHLRWDFRRDALWTFYALGGFAGHVTSEAMGSRFLMFPRFGVGAMRESSLGFAFRGELSHEFITFGLVWPI